MANETKRTAEEMEAEIARLRSALESAAEALHHCAIHSRGKLMRQHCSTASTAARLAEAKGA